METCLNIRNYGTVVQNLDVVYNPLVLEAALFLNSVQSSTLNFVISLGAAYYLLLEE